jgi:NADPH:quinone reductase-like Zn-dependent oxidoreductase
MKAYHISETSGLGGLVMRDSPTPTPDPYEALVRIKARSVNFRDLLILNGRYPVPARPNVIALSDGAGEVVAVGERVTRVKIGDRVAATYFPRWLDGRLAMGFVLDQFGATRDGVLAEFVAAPESALVQLPSHLSFEEGAALPCAAVTAWSCLTGPRPVLPGETVLTIGTGGVALFALQLARTFGAQVISLTSSEEKARRLHDLGATHVINYKAHPDWERFVREHTGGHGADHIVETGGPDTLPHSLASAAVDGQVALVAALAAATLDTRYLGAPLSIRRLYVGSRASFEAMNRAIAHHRIHPVLDRTVPFAEAPEALRWFEAKGHVGKVIIGK